jgi:hypothetical protein
VNFIEYHFTDKKYCNICSQLNQFPSVGDEVIFDANTIMFDNGQMNQNSLTFVVQKITWKIGADTGINTIFILK